MGEYIIQDFLWCYFNYNNIFLCYFNLVGVYESVKIGEFFIIFVFNFVFVIIEVVIGKCKEFVVFGDDYDMWDGSCICDYIYVMDLVNVYIKVLQYVIVGKQEGLVEIFNFGIGEGVMVFEVLNFFMVVMGEELFYCVGFCCLGDVVVIYVNYKKVVD